MTAPSAPVDWVRLTPVQQVSDGEPGPARVSAVGALAFRDFRLLWLGLVGSNIGSWVQDIASSWLLLQMTDSPLMVGLRGLFTSPAFIMASFWGGALADRMDRRNAGGEGAEMAGFRRCGSAGESKLFFGRASRQRPGSNGRTRNHSLAQRCNLRIWGRPF